MEFLLNKFVSFQRSTFHVVESSVFYVSHLKALLKAHLCNLKCSSAFQRLGELAAACLGQVFQPLDAVEGTAGVPVCLKQEARGPLGAVGSASVS